MSRTRTLRKIAAILFSGFLQVGLVLVSMALCATGLMSRYPDQGFDTLVFFVISIVGSSLILERALSDRFWKSYLFSVFCGILPFNLYFVIAAVLEGTQGYWGLGLIVVNFLLVISSLASLPIVGALYWARGRELATYLTQGSQGWQFAKRQEDI